MTDGPQTICIQCGQSAVETKRFNRLEDGRPCPTCSDRLLATLRPLLPGFDPSTEPEVVEEPVEHESNFDDDQPA